MNKLETNIQDVFIIENDLIKDNRGTFLKVFNKDIFKKLELPSTFNEKFYSTSIKDVIRGMHFQIPPYAHEKIIFVPKGKINDIVLDIRKESPTYGKYFMTELSEYNNRSIFIPKGCAHGFLSKEKYNLVVYMQTSVYNPNADSGIRYNSFGFDWGIDNPIISQKDLNLCDFNDFDSPFMYNESAK